MVTSSGETTGFQRIETQSEWSSISVPKADIRMPDVVPPSPIIENDHLQVEPGLLEGEEINFSSCSGYLKPGSLFDLHTDNDNSAIEPVDVQPLRRTHLRRGLLVGVRYNGVEPAVEGAHDDVDDMKEFLVHHHGWREEDILVLKDDGTSNQQPTRDVIIAEMHNLVRDVCAGDVLFLQFSGHGGQIPDMNGDENDGFDEVIYSCDRYPIVDDLMHDILVKPLPAGCRLTAIFDCCSSGTCLDLPVTVLSSISEKDSNSYASPKAVIDKSGSGVVSAELVTSPPLLEGSLLLEHSQHPPSYEASCPSPLTSRWRHTEGDVIMWSSCQDSEWSYEVLARKDHKMKGAMTHAFIECLSLEAQERLTYRQLLDALHEMLFLWGCPQRPMMSSAHHINMHDTVSL
ncbi:caspase domain-containing protein [Gautieria morchelliformis]|nr:caspase domain-containing protein [Gautieria morchelliformis]